MRLNSSSLIFLSIAASTLLSAQTRNPITNSYLELLPIDTFVDTLSLEELSELVVTDTKIAQSSRSVTQNIQIIDQSEFERLSENRRNLSELLQYTSGQFVNVLSRNDANWGSYAGLGAKYNTYMLDGLPIDSFVDPMSLDPWAFERIEIQKGPASILYSNYMSMDFAGNEAPLAGTTNFILKDKIDHQMSRIQIGAGSYNTQNARIYHQNKIGNISYFIGANLEKSDYTQYGEKNSWLQTTEKPDYQKSKLYGKIAYAPDETQALSLFFHHTVHEGDVGRPNRQFDHQYNTLNIKYNRDLSNALKLYLQGGWRDYDRTYNEDKYTDTLSSLDLKEKVSVQQSIIPVDLTLSYLHGNENVLTIGSDAQWTSYKTQSTPASSGITATQNEMKARSNSFFIQEKFIVGEWVLRGGLRYNTIEHTYHLLGGSIPSVNEASWSKTLWNVGARWNLSDRFSSYANSGTSFMTPAGKQVGGMSGQIANPSLKPELGMGNDIGIEYHPTEKMSLGTRVFYNIIDDAIVDNTISPTQTQSFNAGKTVAQGIELDFKHHMDDTLDYFANITYNDTKVKDSKTHDNDGNEIPFVPYYVANIGVTAFLPLDFTTTLSIQRVGKYYDSSAKSSRSEFGNYNLINAKLQKNILRNRDYSINALLELNNIADQRYTMPWGFVDPGFNGYASVAVTF